MARLTLAMALLLAACASPSSRIKARQSKFDAFPEAARRKIRGGDIEVGFTPAMVLIALGEPDRKESKSDGRINREVWTYRSPQPSGSLAGGIAMSDPPSKARLPADERARVIFESGLVTDFTTRDR
ncbi:MAG: hypothetical protein HY078_10355 [Elusimicrobia bacterium]|nr:hypothetical protein [Elusimicrobiota bacterium]